MHTFIILYTRGKVSLKLEHLNWVTFLVGSIISDNRTFTIQRLFAEITRNVWFRRITEIELRNIRKSRVKDFPTERPIFLKSRSAFSDMDRIQLHYPYCVTSFSRLRRMYFFQSLRTYNTKYYLILSLISSD